MSNIDEQKLRSPVEAIKHFSMELADKSRELQKMEDEFKITPGMSGVILEDMIQSFIWTVVQVMRRQDDAVDLASEHDVMRELAQKPNPKGE